ncbi:MAG TPA: amino acid ABC transporter substrate-binding protein [Candidatus Limnocylindrales bacterium]|jgi:general L-amino acid transport system substrate-binding protein|nr:amino acid ABC transporter substrate-binding protein [Candidatus Limnocylindrales bacterium]
MTRFRLSFIGLVVLALVVTACGDEVAPTVGQDSPDPAGTPAATTDDNDDEATPEPAPAGGRLALVRDRGQLICGVNGGLPGFSFVEPDGTNSGFDADFCRAVAAAVLGDAEAVEFRALSADARGPALQTGEVDVLIRNTTWTVSRDTAWGLFAPTTFYDGQAIMVHGDVGAVELEDLEGATICVQSGTTTELNLADQFRAAGINFTPQVYPEIEETYGAYQERRCDAVTSDRSQLVAQRTTFEDPDAHDILEAVLSKEPLGPVAPLGDDPWFNVIKWVVFATFEAEEHGITSDNVDEFVGSENPVIARLLGADGDLGLGLEADWVVDVISQVGNYGEIYDRNLGPGTPFNLDRGLNNLWTEGGLLYAPPYR